MRSRTPPLALLVLPLLLALSGGCGRGRTPPETGPAPAGGTGFTPIHEIQGAGHASPRLGERLDLVTGVVTATDRYGFWLEALPEDRDDDPATSEGIYVYTAGEPWVVAGDEVEVLDPEVSEFGYGELTTTELTDGVVQLVAGGTELPPPVVLGIAGRIPPGEVFDDDALSSFDPETDGLDFWESIESMRVTLPALVATGPRSGWGEIPVVAGDGLAGPRTANGGILLAEGDANPERIFLDDALAPGAPKTKSGDRFADDVTGVVSYSRGRYTLMNLAPLPPLLESGTERGVTSFTRSTDHLTIATWNVENLGPGQFRLSNGRGARIADGIVNRLGSPDVVVLQEVQDGSGPKDDGVVDGRETWEGLVRRILDAGGPEYDWLEVAPRDGADGGAPGANIRVGLLYDPARVGFEPRPPDEDPATTPVFAASGPAGPALLPNPGRIAPGDPAWSEPEPGRRPLAAELTFRGEKLFVLMCHLKSRRQDDPDAGARQPPHRPTEAQRVAQAEVVRAFAEELLAVDPGSRIVVLGDMNDTDFGPAVRTLEGDTLVNLVRRVPVAERYTYIYEGNSQCLDHVLASPALADGEIEIVHLAADFPSAGNSSDHDPVLARFRFP